MTTEPLDLRTVRRMRGVTALFLGVAFTSINPFRVADCGPADPQLLRYLGGPIFHSTGLGVTSSQEAIIWGWYFLANAALLAAVAYALLSLVRAPLYLEGNAGPNFLLFATPVFAAIALASTWSGQDLRWDLTGPPVSAETCEISFEFKPSRRAWQDPVAQ